jgi:DNA-binding SARP family transcriptional activator
MRDQGKASKFSDPVDRVQGSPFIVTLFGPFTIRLDGKSTGPWPRPSARRLCELLMLRPDHRLHRDVARETLFANLAPEASANALRRALSMARQALSLLGGEGPHLLQADRFHIWVPTTIPLDIDLVTHEAALRRALATEPGVERDATLSAALVQDRVLLDDEPYSDWAFGPRDGLELLRQDARFELARDRANGHGWSQPSAVIDAWEACLAHDPGSEEAAAALMRAYGAQGERQLVVRTYRRCGQALEELGLKPSSALERTYLRAIDDMAEFVAPWAREKSAWPTNVRTSLAEIRTLNSEEPAGCALVRS